MKRTELQKVMKRISPLPWKFEPGSKDEWAAVVSADGDTPVLYENDEPMDPKAPNPRYIAHAANNFPGLLAALKHAARRLNEIPHRYADTDFKLIEDAIAKAESL